MRRVRTRNQRGLVAGVLDSMLIVILTVALVVLIVNTGIVMYYKLKAFEAGSFALDYARDIAMRTPNFKGDQAIADHISTLTQAISPLGNKMNIIVKTDDTLAFNPTILVTTTIKNVQLIAPMGPVDVTDRSMAVYRPTVGFLGFQAQLGGGSNKGGHKAGSPIEWVPVVQAPPAHEALPAYAWLLQAPRTNRLEKPTVAQPLHHAPVGPGYCKDYDIVYPGPPVTSRHVHECNEDEMLEYAVAAPTKEQVGSGDSYAGRY